jgi:CheY-like chemotaxis protein
MSSDPRPCRILLVDDHADTRDMLVRLLARMYDVQTAECFDSALAAAEAATPHIVVADVGLPGRNGLELMREMRQRYQVPGIAVTGHAIDNIDEYRSAGFVRWLRKPIQLDELMHALHQICAMQTRSLS